MSEFCKQCSKQIFGEDFSDLKGISTPQNDKKKLYCTVLCEGCGFIQVDSHGKCISKDCLEKHGERND